MKNSFKETYWSFSDASLKLHNYYQLGGNCQRLIFPQTVYELQTILKNSPTPPMILGDGSNVLLSDEYYAGDILCLQALQGYHWISPSLLFSFAGSDNSQIALAGLGKYASDFAWMWKMPGLLGSSIRMNARCYGHEMSEITEWVFSLTPRGEFHMYPGKDVFLGYKKTIFMENQEVIWGSILRIKDFQTSEEILKIMTTAYEDRVKKHHFDYPSCGSTFKNHMELGQPSGKLFQDCGLLGTKNGNAQISPYHGNVIWNLGNASSHAIIELIAQMRSSVLQNIGGMPELEVVPLGNFSYIEKISMGVPEETLPQEVFAKERVLLQGIPLSRFGFHENIQTTVSLLQKESLDFVKWETTIQKQDLSFFEPIPLLKKQYHPTLWEFGVTELFIKGKSEEYLEFEIQPQSECFIVLAFESYRNRKNLSLDYWKDLQWFFNESDDALKVGCVIPIHYLESLNSSKEDFKIDDFQFKCALSSHKGCFDFPPLFQDTPDFHSFCDY
jgi:UDP-N-acetylmuramate dehydrogenase